MSWFGKKEKDRPSVPKVCAGCGGAGKVARLKRADNGRGQDYQWERCPSCGGTGRAF